MSKTLHDRFDPYSDTDISLLSHFSDDSLTEYRAIVFSRHQQAHKHGTQKKGGLIRKIRRWFALRRVNKQLKALKKLKKLNLPLKTKTKKCLYLDLEAISFMSSQEVQRYMLQFQQERTRLWA